MIAVDTSALLAVALDEESAEDCINALRIPRSVLISAGTLAELLIVAAGRSVLREVTATVDGLPLDVRPVTAESARRVARAYEQWGKGLHPAGLNFGDCFAYAVAKENGCPLLFVGDDFSKTDVESVL